LLFGQGAEYLHSIVKPIAPYTKNLNEVVHNPFVDYNSGKTLSGERYWLTLDRIFFGYVNHPEYKFENGDEAGWLRRRKLCNLRLRHMGKEVKFEELTILDEENEEWGDLTIELG
jgi:hypothetical protein